MTVCNIDKYKRSGMLTSEYRTYQLMNCILQRFGPLRKITPPFAGVFRGPTYTIPAQREVIGLSRYIHPTQKKYRNFESSQELSLKVQLNC